MPRQSSNPDVVHKVLAPELGAYTQVSAKLCDLSLPFQVADSTTGCITLARQRVVLPACQELDGLHRHVWAQTADDDREMIRRTSSRAKSRDLLLHEVDERFLVEETLGLLQELRLIGAAASLGDKQKFVFGTVARRDVDLSWQIVPRVRLLEHAIWRHLRITQIAADVCVIDALGEVQGILTICQHEVPTAPNDCGSARILTAGKLPARRYNSVLQQLPRHQTVISASLRVLQDCFQLSEVARPKQVIDICHGLLCQDLQHPAIYV
mmetsp:Transcript_102013/g.197491  ORF Transcript_102013/g.197491 Transcript_102013/m.197491 type:complete len:267 (-) Transcript_102013:333-1133(-)